MADDSERRIAALEVDMGILKAIMPRVEVKLDCHMQETKHSRQATNDKLDAVIGRLDARENQAKGVVFLWETLRALAVFLAGIGAFKWLGLIR